MYYQVVAQCTQSLKNLETCLDKAEQHGGAAWKEAAGQRLNAKRR